MRILALNYEYPPLGGGGGVAAATFAREFARQGHEVDFVTTHKEGLPREESDDGVRVFREPVLLRRDVQTATMASMLSYPVVAARRALKLTKARSYDVINTHFAIPTGPAGFVVSRLRHLPNVVSVYGADVYDPSRAYSPHRVPALRVTVKAILDAADAVVAESNDIEDRVNEIYSPRSSVSRIPLGFDPPTVKEVSREELGLDNDRVYAIAVSRLVARKAYPDLFRAFRTADVKGLELLIVGDGPEEPQLRTLASELGIADRVRFLGFQEEARKYQLLRAADFFALASLHEGFGIVFQEAMYSGLPIATTNVGGQMSFLTHGRNGLLTAPSVPDELAESLATLAKDETLRREMGSANSDDIQDHMVGVVAKRYLDLFAGLVERNGEQ